MTAISGWTAAVPGVRTVLSCGANAMASVLTIAGFTKAAGDRVRVACDFGNEPLLRAGYAITDQSAATSGAGAPTASGAALESNGYEVSVLLDGGTAGTYDVIFSVTLNDPDATELVRTSTVEVL